MRFCVLALLVLTTLSVTLTCDCDIDSIIKDGSAGDYKARSQFYIDLWNAAITICEDFWRSEPCMPLRDKVLDVSN